jgi:hypothetical protein
LDVASRVGLDIDTGVGLRLRKLLRFSGLYICGSPSLPIFHVASPSQLILIVFFEREID